MIEQAFCFYSHNAILTAYKLRAHALPTDFGHFPPPLSFIVFGGHLGDIAYLLGIEITASCKHLGLLVNSAGELALYHLHI